MRAQNTNFSILFLIAAIMSLAPIRGIANEKDEADLMARLRGENMTMKTIGGGKGDIFGYAYLHEGERFTEITLHWKSVVDGISFKTDLDHSTKYGNIDGSGDNPKDTNHGPPLTLTKNQYIASITIEAADYQPKKKTYKVIKAITFHIRNRNGNAEPDFKIRGEDTSNGAHRSVIDLTPDPANEICGFWGYFGTVMDSLGIIQRPIK